jgi:adenosylcobinamide kinase/adenosylcobinamide-phosphate guanylyltransferase
MAERLLKKYRIPEPHAENVYAGEVQALAEKAGSPAELAALADRLAGFFVVTASETGCGVIPADRAEREKREKAGRLNCLLAERASAVVRMCCGIPSVLKGTLALPPEPEDGS